MPRLTCNGIVIEAAAGTSVAAVLMNANQPVRRSISGEIRGPLCGMGICFECRATINGVAHERTCQIQVREGMEVNTGGL